MTSGAIRTRPPRDAVRSPRLESAPDAVAARLEDAARFGGTAEALAVPESEGEWAWLLSCGRPVHVVGAQSSLTGGATPRGGIVAATDAGRAILGHGSDWVRVGAGVTVTEVLAHASPRRLFYPPAPTYTGATVGGTVATNAAGAATFKYGTTRQWVRALTVVLPGGDVLDVTRGQCVVQGGESVELARLDGSITRIPAPSHALPRVRKRACGYYSGPIVDLVDLFIGAEGTLGVVTEIELGLLPRAWETFGLVALLPGEARGFELVASLREQSRRTWRDEDPHGVDVAAIEHLDARTLAILREEGKAEALGVPVRPGHEMALLILAELAAGTSGLDAQDELADLDDPSRDSRLLRTCRLVRDHGGLDDAALALPGEEGRLAELFAFREAAPEAINARIGRAKREVDPRIRKVGGDVVVPFEHLPELSALCHEVPARRGLDAATWGHASDGNLHPNVLPRTFEEVAEGEEAQLEIGREAIRLGGSPMAEHGVGRHPVKQQLLRELLGPDGMSSLRAVKAALDPGGVLASGVIFSAHS